MNYRDIIPADRLKKFDKHGLKGVQTLLDANLLAGKQKTHATLYVTERIAEQEEVAAERDAAAADREEARAAEALEISRKALETSSSANSIAVEALRSGRLNLKVVIIATVVASIAMIATVIMTYNMVVQAP